MFPIDKPSQLITMLAVLILMLLPGSLTADTKPGTADIKPDGNYSYCRGPGFSEPRGFGYSDQHQWRSEFMGGDEQKQNAFMARTRELRRNITAKERALRAELEQANIDKAKALQLQKELSVMRSQMEQYQLEHLIEMKKLDADPVNEAKK